MAVFRFRDLPMAPERGTCRGAMWLQFFGSVHLRLPLRGDHWCGVQEGDFEFKVSDKEISVACDGREEREADLLALSGSLKYQVNPENCWFCLEWDGGHDGGDGPCGEAQVLVVELAKKLPGVTWQCGDLFKEAIFTRRAFCWTPPQQKKEQHSDSWVTVAPGRRPDSDDPYVASPSWLCKDIEFGQDDGFLQLRAVIDREHMEQVAQRVPIYEVFGVDCSRELLRVFIRGDESHPILYGELGGRVNPERTAIELTQSPSDESVLYFDILIEKATGATGEWADPIRPPRESAASMACHHDQAAEGPSAPQQAAQQVPPERIVEPPQLPQRAGQPQERGGDGARGKHETRQPDAELASQREEHVSLLRRRGSPGEISSEHREKAEAAVRAGAWRDAIVAYTRALRYTPEDEGLFTARSMVYSRVDRHHLALDDISQAERINAKCPEAKLRKGQALRGLERFDAALAAFLEGQAIDAADCRWKVEIERTRMIKAALLRRAH